MSTENANILNALEILLSDPAKYLLVKRLREVASQFFDAIPRELNASEQLELLSRVMTLRVFSGDILKAVNFNDGELYDLATLNERLSALQLNDSNYELNIIGRCSVTCPDGPSCDCSMDGCTCSMRYR
jgi:hypothetical protein